MSGPYYEAHEEKQIQKNLEKVSREQSLRSWSKIKLNEDRKKILMDIRIDVHKKVFDRIEKYGWDKAKYFIFKRINFYSGCRDTLSKIILSEFILIKNFMEATE